MQNLLIAGYCIANFQGPRKPRSMYRAYWLMDEQTNSGDLFYMNSKQGEQSFLHKTHLDLLN